MKNNYAYQGDDKGIAKALGRDLPISTKQAINICKVLRGKEVIKARSHLERVQKKQEPIRFTRFSEGAGHKRGKGGMGKYPIKATANILLLLKQVEANAQQQGIFSELKIVHVCAQSASSPVKGGRHRGRESKRTHVEIIVKEIPGKKRAPRKDAAPKKEQPKVTVPKKESKPEVKKETTKQTDAKPAPPAKKEPVKAPVPKKEGPKKSNPAPVKKEQPVKSTEGKKE